MRHINLKFILSILLISLIFLGGIIDVNASVEGLPDSFTLQKPSVNHGPFGNSEDDIYFASKRMEYNGVTYIVYCGGSRVVSSVSDVYTISENAWNKKVQAGVAAIMNSRVSNYDEYMKQLAIWQWLYDNGLVGADNNIFNSYSYVTKPGLLVDVKNLYDIAVAEGNRVSQTFSISVNDTLNFTKSGSNYVSNVIKVTGSDIASLNTPTVTGPAGTTISGNNNDGYIVTVPVSSLVTGNNTVTVSFKANRNPYSLAYQYVHGNYQQVTPNITKQVVETAETSVSGGITIKNQKNEIKFIKYSLNDGILNFMPGVKLHIEDSNGSIAKDVSGNSLSWTSTEQPYVVKELKPGVYYLVEEEVPSGYSVSSKIKFEVKSDGTFTTADLNLDLSDTELEKITGYDNIAVIMVNRPTRVEISKTSFTTGEELPGATLQILDKDKNPILDEDGNEMYKWVSTTSPHVIEGLPEGVYYLKEIIAPDGYVKFEEMIEFEVKSDGTVTKVEMTNDSMVNVPNTLSTRSTLLLVIALVSIVLGSGILIYTKRKQV